MQRHAEALIALARVGAPGQDLRPQPVNELVAAAAARAGVTSRLRLRAETIPTVRGAYVEALRHLLVEVLDNAARFSPAEQIIDVAVSPIRGGVVIQVTDRGIGMSSAELAEATRVMAANANPASPGPRTSRMGLAVVARAATALGARVRIAPVRSHPGTQVALALPAAIMEGPGAAPPAAGPAASEPATDRPRPAPQDSPRPRAAAEARRYTGPRRSPDQPLDVIDAADLPGRQPPPS